MSQSMEDIHADIDAWVDRTLPLFEGAGISNNFRDALVRAARRVAAEERSAA